MVNLRKDTIEKLLENRRQTAMKKANNRDTLDSNSTGSEDEVPFFNHQSYRIFESLKEKLDSALSTGAAHLLTSLVTEVKINLAIDGENRIPFSQFMEAGILSQIMPFINFDFNSFEKLREETLQVVSILSSGSKMVINSILDERYIDRIKMILINSQLTPTQLNHITITLGNFIGTDISFRTTLTISGVFWLVLNEWTNFKSYQILMKNTIWLLSNSLRGKPYLKSCEATNVLFNMLDCLEVITDQEEEVLVETIWGVLYYVFSHDDLDFCFANLIARDIVPGLVKYFEDCTNPQMIAPIQKIISKLFQTEKGRAYITEQTMKVCSP